MKATDKEILNQIVSRTDKTGNEKVEMLIEFVEQQLKNCNALAVSGMFSAEMLEKAYNDGVNDEQIDSGEFDIENYRITATCMVSWRITSD